MRSQSELLAVVSGQLKSASEQLERESEQLKSVSEQKAGSIYRRLYFHIAVKPLFLVIIVALAEQDTELGQLRQAIDQLRQEKAKEIERVDKLAEELKGEFLLVVITF